MGPNLDRSTLSVEQTADKIANGGGPMPAFGSQFSPEQIEAIAEYVVSSRDPDAEGGGGGGGGGGIL